MFWEAIDTCWHSQGLSPKQMHAGEEPRPSSDNDDFFTWYKFGLKPKNLSEPTRGDNVTKLKKYLKAHTISFPTLLKSVAEVPLPSTEAWTSRVRGEGGLPPSQENSLKEKQSRKQGISVWFTPWAPQSHPGLNHCMCRGRLIGKHLLII